jgi:hypothetical protein
MAGNDMVDWKFAEQLPAGRWVFRDFPRRGTELVKK